MPVVVINCESEGERVMRALEIINATGGRFFHASNIKRTTGKTRAGQYRINVQRYVTGAGMAYIPKEHDLRGVWEANNAEGATQAEAYRMLDLRTINNIKTDGMEYVFLPQIQEFEVPEKKK